jgi:hypothetical protein
MRTAVQANPSTHTYTLLVGAMVTGLVDVKDVCCVVSEVEGKFRKPSAHVALSVAK